MNYAAGKRLISLALVIVMTLGLVPALPQITANAEKTVRGGIDEINLAIDHEPHTGYVSNTNYALPAWGATPLEDNPKYEVGFSGLSDPASPYYDPHFQNGVAWFDETANRYLSTDISSLAGQFTMLHEYRVEIVVHSRNILSESYWFALYDDTESAESLVSATISGTADMELYDDINPKMATVSPYIAANGEKKSISEYLLITYTYAPAVHRNRNTIDVVEVSIDEPRDQREVSFDAREGNYAGKMIRSNFVVNKSYNDSEFVNGVRWEDVTDDIYNPVTMRPGDFFQKGRDYQVSIIVVPRYTGSFDYTTKGFVNEIDINNNPGGKLDGVLAGDKKVTLCYTFKNIGSEVTDYVSCQVYGLAGPIAGMTPDAYPRAKVTCDYSAGSNVEVATAYADGFVNDMKWVYTDTYYPVREFKKGENYTLIMSIRTTGYVSRFHTYYDQEKGRVVNGLWGTYIPDIGDEVVFMDAFNDAYIENDPAHRTQLRIDFPPCRDIVGDASFAARTPKEGEVNNTTVTDDSAYYNAYNVYWKDDTTGSTMGASEKFVAGHSYSLHFEVRTSTDQHLLPMGKVGGFFDRNGKTVKELVNGRDAVITYKNNYDPDSSNFYMRGPWYSFNVSVDMGVCNDSVIEEIALSVTPPTAGAHPSYAAVNLGSGYHIRTEWEKSTEEYWHNPVTYRYYGRNGVQWWPSDPGTPEHLYEDEVFEEGKQYTVTVYVEADDGFEFAQNKDGENLAVATVNGQQADGLQGGTAAKTRQEVRYTFICGEATGYNVSGTVYSQDAPAAPTVIRLYSGMLSEPDYEAAAYGTTANFTIPNVPEGNYTMKISKEGYVAQTLSIRVDGKDLTTSATLDKPGAGRVWGDATGDGAINNKDIVRLKNYLANYDNVSHISRNGNTVYALAPGADANGDNEINNKDIVRLKNYLTHLDGRTGISTFILGPSV